MTTDDDRRKDTAAILGPTLGTALLAIETSSPLAVIPLVFTLGMRLFMERSEFRARRWVDGFLGKELTEDEAEKLLNKGSQDPKVCDAIVESLRRMLEATDDAAAAPLGALARSYARSGKKPDAFFRALGRALMDMSGEEIEAMRLLLQAVVNAESPEDVRMTGAAVENHPAGVRIATHPAPFFYLGELPEYPRIVQLLKSHGLGREPDPGIGSGWLALGITKTTARQVLLFIGQPELTGEPG